MLPAISVVTHVCTDVSQPSLMLQTKDGKRYLIGRLGEGFQRTLIQKKFRSQKLAGIFISGQHTWESMVGLPGYLLSSAGIHNVKTIHSGLRDKAAKLIDTFKYFIAHTPLDLSVAESDIFEDSNVIIQPVNIDGYKGPSVSYILQMLPVRGRFVVQKARDLGVPPGPLFGQLSGGASVVTPSGNTVYPEDVLESSPTPSRVLVLDLPSEEHVSNALNIQWNCVLKRKRDDQMYDVSVRALFYFLGEDVQLNSKKFAELRSLFPASAQSFISQKQFSPNHTIWQDLAAVQKSLGGILPECFSCVYAAGPARTLETCKNLHVMRQLDLVALAPLTYTPSSEAAECDLGYAEPLSEDIDEPQVHTLGTGSSAPSKYRNVSGAFIRVPTKGGIRMVLLDCGEGTLSSLGRFYNPEGRDLLLREMALLYISHMHADHHLGVVPLIRQWQLVNPDRILTIVAPHQLHVFLNEITAIDGDCLDLGRLMLIDNKVFLASEDGSAHDNTSSKILETLGFKLANCRAIHCQDSYSVTLDFELLNGSKFRMSYSGDTRPNPQFARLGRHSDLLLHEATHSDELAAEAKMKRHSTIGEALTVAKQMQAKHVVLTHFSQRYPSLPDYPSTNFEVPTCFALDGMRCKLSDVQKLQDLAPKICGIFEEHWSASESTNEEIWKVSD